jgi:cell division protein FtsI/penicillin-binding protein 2
MANGGKAIQPHVVQEIKRSDGQNEKTQINDLNQVISARASRLITAMLTSVVERTYTQTVRLDHYFVAGKTGTAQIAGPRGYSETDTNHTFCGFLPAKNPKVVIVVKYEKPQRLWAEGTAAITFRDLAKFTMDYYGVEEDR